MIKHIVMWRIKNQPSKKINAAQAKNLLESMREKIPGLIKIEVGINFIEDINAADLVLYTELKDQAALTIYQTHPIHEAVKPLLRDLTTERRVIDYVLED